MTEMQCCICDATLPYNSSGDDAYLNCPACGSYRITGTAKAILKNSPFSSIEKGKLLYLIKSLHHPRFFEINNTTKEELSKIQIPPNKQKDLLLEYLYKNEESLALKLISNQIITSVIAVYDSSSILNLLTSLEELGYLKISNSTMGGNHWIALTFKGFEAYDAVIQGKNDSKMGFMALQFGGEANQFYETFLKPALVEHLGGQHYTIMRLDEAPETGNVSNRMEAEIRRCGFLIADITPAIPRQQKNEEPQLQEPRINPNVMWEAGFAEGLNKVVLYICDMRFKDAKKPFDIDQKQHVYYDASSEETANRAVSEMLATITNTFAKRSAKP